MSLRILQYQLNQEKCQPNCDQCLNFLLKRARTFQLEQIRTKPILENIGVNAHDSIITLTKVGYCTQVSMLHSLWELNEDIKLS